MKVLIVNRFFGGAQIPTGRMAEDVARWLVEEGHEVVALASSGEYDGAARCLDGLRQTASGLRVEQVRVPKWMPRALAWVWFTWQVRKRIPKMDWDVCVLMTDPPLLPLLAAKAKAAEGLRDYRTTGLPDTKRRIAVWLMDLYPEALAASGRIAENNPLYRWYFNSRQMALAASDLLICLGQSQKQLVETVSTQQAACGLRPTRIAVVPPWDDRENIALATEESLKNLALYAGNLGEAHCFEEILAAAPYLPGDWTIRFAVRGAKLDALRAKARNLCHSRPQGDSARHSRGQINAAQKKASHGLTRMKGRISPLGDAERTGQEYSSSGTPGSRNASSDGDIAEVQEGGASLLGSSSFGLFSSLGAKIEITGYASEEETPELLASARVHLITMSPGWEGIVVPSKLYGCVRTGRPVVFIGPENADTAREIRAHDWGKVLPPGASGEEVAAAILKLASRPTRTVQSDNGAGEIGKLLQTLATDRNGSKAG